MCSTGKHRQYHETHVFSTLGHVKLGHLCTHWAYRVTENTAKTLNLKE